jgi:hypothetical protein
MRTAVAFAVALACVAAIVIHIAHLRFVFDDAFIHFRIAENLAFSGQPYFHIGDPLKSSSSSAWTILLAIVFRALGRVDLRAIATLNSLVTVGLGLAAAAQIRVALPKSPSWIAGLTGFAVAAGTLSASTGLMETPLAVLIVSIGFLILARGSTWGFVLLGAACGFRLEAFIFLGAAAVAQAALDRRRIWPAAGWAVGGYLPFVIYDLAFFRTLIPQPVRAKSVTYGLSHLESLWSAMQEFPDAWIMVITFALSGLLAVLVVIRLMRSGRAKATTFLSAFIASGPILFVAYNAVRAFVFPWYLPLFYVPIIVGLGAALTMVGRRVAVIIAAVLLLPAATVLVGKVAGAFGHPEYSISSEANARVNQYLDVGEGLHRVCPGCNILTSEIGGLGYASGSEIIDAVGLVTPEAVRYHPMPVPDQRPSAGFGSIPPQMVADFEPDLIVSYDIFAYALLRSDVTTDYAAWRCPPFTAADREVPWLEQLWGINDLWIWASAATAQTVAAELESSFECVSS